MFVCVYRYIFNVISVLEIIEQPQSQKELYENKVVMVVGVAAGPNTLSYQWMKDGDVITDTTLPGTTGTNTSTLQINCLSPEHNGQYRCVISCEGCMLQSETATLKGIDIITVYKASTYAELSCLNQKSR